MLEDGDFLLEAVTESFALNFEIVVRLKIQPELLSRPEVAAEPQRGVGRDGSRSMHDLVDTSWRDADVLGQAILGQTERFQEILQEDFTRVDRVQLARCHEASVIINDLDFVRVTVGPPEADAPLVVDANAVLSGSVTLQFFQAVSRWDPQVVERVRCVENDQLSEHGVAERSRKAPNGLSGEQPLGISVSEALDHPAY